MYPGARRIAVEEIGGALDQILKIELASLLFQILEIADQSLSQNKRAFRRLQHSHQTIAITTGHDMVPRKRQRVDEIGCGFLHALVDDIGIGFFSPLAVNSAASMNSMRRTESVCRFASRRA